VRTAEAAAVVAIEVEAEAEAATARVGSVSATRVARVAATHPRRSSSAG